MSPIEQQQGGDEPIGIVISRGSREAPPPRVLAYVWGPAPEDVLEPVSAMDEQKAA